MKSIMHICAVVTTLFVAENAGASDLAWELLAAKSVGKGVSCAENTVQLANAGDDMALFFEHMNIDMPANVNANVKLQHGTCYVFLKFTVPQGYSISSNSSVVMGGVTKDTGASGYVDLVSTITRNPANPSKPFSGLIPFGPMMHLFQAFNAVSQVNNPLFEISKSKKLSTPQKNSLCRLTKNGPRDLGMFVQLSVAGVRKNSSKTNIIAIDSFDNHLTLGLKTDVCPNI